MNKNTPQYYNFLNLKGSKFLLNKKHKFDIRLKYIYNL